MNRLLLVVIGLIFSGMETSAQATIEKYKSRWQVKQAFGYNVPLTKLLKGEVTDYLIDAGDRGIYWQVLSATHFFSKHWGIEFNYQLTHSKDNRKRIEHFVGHITPEYANYHQQVYTTAEYDRFSIVDGDIERGQLGLIYRLESDRFFAYPKLSIGITSFYTDYGAVMLKEKNTNNVKAIIYTQDSSPGSSPVDHFSLAASSAMGYKLSNRFFVNMDIATSWYKPNFSFLKTTTDRYTGHQTEETIDYKNHIFTLSGGIGIIFVIR
jgi:hypothetical protein